MPNTLTGGCFCGRTRYELPVDAVRFGFASCHCGVCRRTHGAPFVQWLGLGAADAARFTLAPGAAPTAFRTSPIATKYFCPTCGTHTHLAYDPGDGRWAGELHVATATLDEACIPALEAHMRAHDRPRAIHVFFASRGACLGDLDAWAAAPKHP